MISPRVVLVTTVSVNELSDTYCAKNLASTAPNKNALAPSKAVSSINRRTSIPRPNTIGPRAGRHQGEHGEDNYEEVIRNAAASSLAFHGSPVSRLAGTAARYNPKPDSIIGKRQYKKNSVSFALVPGKACTYSPQSKSPCVKGEGFLAMVVASLES